MHDHKDKEHKHDGCRGHEHQHDHAHHHVHGSNVGHEHDPQHEHDHSHHHTHAHDGHHTHAHDGHHDHHAHDGHHDHAHCHKHLSAHECTTLFNQAQASVNTVQAVALLIEAGSGFAHLGDAAATAAVNGELATKVSGTTALTALQRAQMNALKGLELALTRSGGKETLAKSVEELENFSGHERAEVEQLLADVRKALAGLRATGLKSLLSKLKF